MNAEVRPGYKLTEVGLIPEDWEVKSLGECLASPPRYGINAAAAPYSYRLPAYIRITDISPDGRFSPEKPVSVDDIQASNYYLLDGDLVLARTGASVGKFYKYDANDGPLVFAGFLILIRPNPTKLLSGYIASYLSTSTYWNWVRLMSMRSGQPGINGREYSQLPIPVPTISEQRKISITLFDIDRLIKSLDQLIGKKRDIQQATMQQLLTGQRRLPRFSGKWAVKRLESISAFITKGSTPTTYGFGWVTQGVLFLRSECVSANGLDLSQAMFISDAANVTLRRSEVKAGDILMTITGNVGRTVFLDSRCDSANINQHIARIRVSCEKTDTRFVFYYLSRKEIRDRLEKITTGQAYPQLSLKQVRELLIDLPSLEEQTAIANTLSEMAAEIAALEARRDKTRQLKQGMMQELLTGKTRLL